MGRIRRIVASLALSLVLLPALACGGSKDRAAHKAKEVTPKTVVRLAPKPVESLYDSEGRLKPSGLHVSWLELPVGLAETGLSAPRHHVYSAKLPMEKLNNFFEARLLTGEISLLGQSVSFRRAGPKSMDESVAKIDVTLYPNGDTVMVTIDEHTYGGAKPLSVEDAKAALAHERRWAE